MGRRWRRNCGLLLPLRAGQRRCWRLWSLTWPACRLCGRLQQPGARDSCIAWLTTRESLTWAQRPPGAPPRATRRTGAPTSWCATHKPPLRAHPLTLSPPGARAPHSPPPAEPDRRRPEQRRPARRLRLLRPARARDAAPGRPQLPPPPLLRHLRLRRQQAGGHSLRETPGDAAGRHGRPPPHPVSASRERGDGCRAHAAPCCAGDLPLHHVAPAAHSGGGGTRAGGCGGRITRRPGGAPGAVF